MTKQQAISLKLAQWLGHENVRLTEIQVDLSQVTYGDGGHWKYVFNPFASTTEGRAQFAECWDKACEQFWTVIVDRKNAFISNGDDIHWICEINENTDRYAALIEAIYYAIGGVREWVE